MLEVHLFGVYCLQARSPPSVLRTGIQPTSTNPTSAASHGWLADQSVAVVQGTSWITFCFFSVWDIIYIYFIYIHLPILAHIYKHQLDVPLKKHFRDGSLLTSRVDELCNSSKCHVKTWRAFPFSLPSFSAGITGGCWNFRVERWHTSLKNEAGTQ